MATQIHGATSQGRLVIVDPRLDDYRDLVEAARKHLLRLTMTTTGGNALRLVPSFTDAVWLLSPQLPDMNGLDLLEMLHTLQRNLKAVVVDNQYDLQREQRALELRAVQYVCKPVQLSWLKAWQVALVAVQESNPLHEQPNEAEYSV
ncbi:MAG: response regulator [Planctomycetes bacterium]|nr:response regulator [Planctomycetota bacterium]